MADRAPAGLPGRWLAGERARWADLWAWLRRRPVHLPGEVHPYARTLTPVLATFIGLSVVEIAAVHLLLHWIPVRIAALVLGCYGLAWMLGMLAGLRMHPHTVADDGVHVRSGAGVQLAVPWDAITAVRPRVRSVEGMRSVQIADAPDGRVVSVPVAGQTNVDVQLHAAATVAGSRAIEGQVREVRLYVDDPSRLVRAVRDRLDTPAGPGRGAGGNEVAG